MEKDYLCKECNLNSMRILFYCDTVFTFGGVQRVLAEIAKALSKEHEVTILTTDTCVDLSMYGYKQSLVQFEYISYTGSLWIERFLCRGYGFLYKYILPFSRCTSALYAKSFFLPRYKHKLVRKINNGNYQVVVGVHAYLSLHLASVRNRIHSVKTIGWMHNSYVAFFEKENPYLPGLKNFFEYEMSELDKVIVLSRIDKEKYEKNLNLGTEVIYNPLTIEVKGRANLQTRRFLSIGRFSEGHKGIDILIKAFALFAVKNEEWLLDIVGEGPEESLYRSLIAAHHLENRVQIHPFTKDINLYYTRSSVYVLASRWEGMPLVLMEAMAYGLPVIASDVPIVQELLEGKEMAILFKKGDTCCLANCLEYMAQEADLSEMSDKAVAYAECFKMDRIIKQWEEIIN
ncbi:glycosyltransferase [Phocaeicola sp.]